jgi:hypothetical protein
VVLKSFKNVSLFDELTQGFWVAILREGGKKLKIRDLHTKTRGFWVTTTAEWMMKGVKN